MSTACPICGRGENCRCGPVHYEDPVRVREPKSKRKKQALSPAAEAERLLHQASTVADNQRRKSEARVKIEAARADIRENLSHPNGSWVEQERAALARIRQALETAAELLEEK